MPKERTSEQHQRDQDDVLRYRSKIRETYNSGDTEKLQKLGEYWKKQDTSFAKGNVNLISWFLELLGKK